MRTNSIKVRKILGRIGQHLNAFLKPFALEKHQYASAWMQHSQPFIWFRKSNKAFSYTIFPVKKINVGKVLKLWENHYLNILYIHILKFEISGCANLLVRVFEFVDLGGVGIDTWWSFWFSTFSFFYISDQVLKTNKNRNVRTRDSRKAMHELAIPLGPWLLSSLLRFNDLHG
jgi:hypothetical protein